MKFLDKSTTHRIGSTWRKYDVYVAMLVLALGCTLVGVGVGKFLAAAHFVQVIENGTEEMKRLRSFYQARLDEANARVAELGGKAAQAAAMASDAAQRSSDVAESAIAAEQNKKAPK